MAGYRPEVREQPDQHERVRQKGDHGQSDGPCRQLTQQSADEPQEDDRRQTAEQDRQLQPLQGGPADVVDQRQRRGEYEHALGDELEDRVSHVYG